MIELNELLSFVEHEWMLPAVVIGFAERCWEAPDLPCLVSFDQQYAGNACAQQALTGVLLPLALRHDAEVLVADLAVLGCTGPNDPPIRARPDLAPLHLCPLEQYRPRQRAVLDQVLARGPSLPTVVAAAEALVELDASEPLRFFGGWRLHTNQPLDEHLLDAVRALRPDRPLRVFLVWWNSD